MTISLELLVLQFVKSVREGNFQLYTETLGNIVQWIFALNHTHYARWLPIHIRDMVQLEQKHPTIHREFLHGNFSVQKTDNIFSSIALDQNHE